MPPDSHTQLKPSGTTTEEIFNQPRLLKQLIAVHLPSDIILCYAALGRRAAPGERRPEDRSFSRAESVCCLLFLPTVF